MSAMSRLGCDVRSSVANGGKADNICLNTVRSAGLSAAGELVHRELISAGCITLFVLVRLRCPPEIVDKLNKETNAILADPKVKARFADLAATLLAGSPADFGKLVADETKKWAKVVKFSGAKRD
jgi:hypothetical protein